jgi:UDP-2,3-diacylglucosamine pyrophosphatase LpxH
MTTTAKKKIFISDVHMGDVRSIEGEHGEYPYGRFRENIAILADFLEELLESPEVPEVVILGDLFDTWVIPTGDTPLIDFKAICNNDYNKRVITALQQLAAQDILTYVPGNHDMIMSTAEQNETQKFINDTFKHINYEHGGVYLRGTLAAEHGHRYALCNAPDPWTSESSSLPIGYFISRLEAYKVSKTGEKQDFRNIFNKFFANIMSDIFDPNTINNLFHGLLISTAQDAGLNRTARINMDGLPGLQFQDNTVDEIGKRYKNFLENWRREQQDIHLDTAAFGEIGALDRAAFRLYFKPDLGQNIVIFGHTHKAEMWVDIGKGKKTLLPTFLKNHLNRKCRSIYVNCGTWVDRQPCTYVETEENAAEGRHYVRLLAYPGHKLLRERFVELLSC